MAEKPSDDKDKDKKSEEASGDAGKDKADTSADSKNTDTSADSDKKKDDDSVPRSRLNEESNKRREAEKKADALEKANREREEAAAVEAGNFKALAETKQKRIDELEAEVARLKPLAERADALEKQATESLQDRVKKLPDEVKALAPEGLESLQKWLPGAEALAEKLNGNGSNGKADDKKADTKDSKKDAPRGAGKTPKENSSNTEKDELTKRARAQQMGLTTRSF